MQRAFIVDVESTGPTPYSGVMTEFAVVDFDTHAWFHGHLYDFDWPAGRPSPVVAHGAAPTPAFTSDQTDRASVATTAEVFRALIEWAPMRSCRPVFVSDNPGFDWMWLADGFDRAGLQNPFGWSSRRIGDLAAGLSGRWQDTSGWKVHRRTTHDHNPVNDALGNAEALRTLLIQHDQLP